MMTSSERQCYRIFVSGWIVCWPLLYTSGAGGAGGAGGARGASGDGSDARGSDNKTMRDSYTSGKNTQ